MTAYMLCKHMSPIRCRYLKKDAADSKIELAKQAVHYWKFDKRAMRATEILDRTLKELKRAAENFQVIKM